MGSKDIFKQASVLDDWLLRRPSFVFDYDGTLAPMFEKPADAYMRPRTRLWLSRLAGHAPCAVLTGRPVKDVRVFLGDVPLKLIVGNHGAEWSSGPSSAHRLTQKMRTHVLQWSKTQPGIVTEDKNGFGMSLHWRQVPRARWQAIEDFVATLKNVRIVPGHHVHNILPGRAPGKAQAVVKLRKALGRKEVVFMGDDVTDEYAFQLDVPWLLGIRVGHRRGSAAPWYIQRQSDMDTLLQRLARRVIEVDETSRRQRR